ncbi:NUDIX domain-containing protein [Asticcacaulis sp. EMRT-3]|uniref:NUDIX domain-containing protein n=1 Tax=Asticcacaulis sp. EMRT-3 TaxID=3040349 RepID=UPI0024AECEEB|nr:NUDIX domain-containing protein [Asticcacaulis sp. EMRT-3]MDI7775228.1 NUDIX domain-containing protein [Asticcacaulis sp. EMRT-3]
MEDWKRIVEPYSRPFFFAWSRTTRGKTLGVRGLVVDKDKRVLLVEHTYLEGWWLPGGGVDTGETAHEAVARELREEAGVNPVGLPQLLSVHSNERFFPGDHVLVFRVDDFEACAMTSHAEIKNVDFFALDALPDNINAGSLRRIQEALMGFPPDPLW